MAEPTPVQLMIWEVAALLGVSQPRIHQLIATGRLKAERRGHYWFVWPADVEAVRVRVTGWPKGRKRGKKSPITTSTKPQPQSSERDGPS